MPDHSAPSPRLSSRPYYVLNTITPKKPSLTPDHGRAQYRFTMFLMLPQQSSSPTTLLPRQCRNHPLYCYFTGPNNTRFTATPPTILPLPTQSRTLISSWQCWHSPLTHCLPRHLAIHPIRKATQISELSLQSIIFIVRPNP
jgi:hypothetical protein